MKAHWRHRWDLTPAEARELQCVGRARLDLATSFNIDAFRRAGRLAAVDVGYDRATDRCFAALVVWDVARKCVLDERTHVAASTYPYVPGLLSFREIPPLLPLFRNLREPIDLILCDGQGIAHPRRFGLASHLGVIYECPSLGWAKSRLIGTYREPSRRRASATRLMDAGEQIGWAHRSRERCRVTFVSPGHRVSMQDSIRIARALLGPYRLCEPARAAHALTQQVMREA